MTSDWLFIAPRTKEDFPLQEDNDLLSVNSTGMIGLLLTKSLSESNLVEELGPTRILAVVGSPWINKSH
jgi:ATP adenylyltransferase/5',5'''-P-1,P-4-tetraphosphate phosphorylase II